MSMSMILFYALSYPCLQMDYAWLGLPREECVLGEASLIDRCASQWRTYNSRGPKAVRYESFSLTMPVNCPDFVEKDSNIRGQNYGTSETWKIPIPDRITPCCSRCSSLVMGYEHFGILLLNCRHPSRAYTTRVCSGQRWWRWSLERQAW